jgi:hypothetical protein
MRGSGGGPEELQVGAADGIAVTFGHGIVRVGKLAAQDGRTLVVDFPPRRLPTLAVGARTLVRLGARREKNVPATQSVLVVERDDRREGCRYRLQLLDAPLARARVSRAAADLPARRDVDVMLRFGRLEYPAQLLAARGSGLRLRVLPRTEKRLRIADFLDLVITMPPLPRATLPGWIDRRVLEGTHVRYEFRFDDELTDDAARQHARLEEILAAARIPKRI